MIRAALIALFLLVPTSLPAQAQTSVTAPGSVYATEAPALYAMFEAMGLYEVLGIMAQEHYQGAEALEASMFPGEGGASWQAQIATFYSHDRLVSLFEDSFPRDALSAEHVTVITEFMRSPVGQRLIEGEIAARRAFLDASALEQGSAALVSAMEAEDVRLETLLAFNEVNDLIHRNVSGAMNARFAFFRGLVDGGAFDDDMGEDFMLDDVWSQEPAIRQDTIEWLFSFQFTAYSGLDNADLQAYVDHSLTDAGQAIIAALFVAFDDMIGALSYEMGYAAAGYIGGEDI
ncbi:hypothetical protein [Gymnodinialimonas ulvae]|uniref:hypothetical protein n=1 Tax=Gymnodinialimonas ulvae TaxID=3126504 RepID=UPI0030A32EE5